MKLGVYVGSFNPVHKGHISVVNYLINKCYVDKIIMIPTGCYWNKTDLLDINDRINMLKFYKTDKIIVDDKLWKYQYTYQVLDVLHEEYPSDILYLIMGADNIINFHLWKNYQDIINNNKILVLPRNGININKYLNKFISDDNFIVVDKFDEMNISSSNIRDKIKNKLYDELDNIIDDKVLEYAVHNGLYE